MRALSDYLAKEFAARGIPALSDHRLFDGHQILSFPDGKNIFVSPFASDAEISAAVFKAFNMTDDNIETTPEAPKPSEVNEAARAYLATADKMPVVDLAPVVQKPVAVEPRMGGIMSKGYRPGSLKALLDGLHKEGQSLMQDVAEEALKVQKAYGHLRAARDDLKAHSEAIRSELGQFSNFADDE